MFTVTGFVTGVLVSSTVRCGPGWDEPRAALTLVGTVVPLEISGSVASCRLRREILDLIRAQVPFETGLDGEGWSSLGESLLAQRPERVMMMQ